MKFSKLLLLFLIISLITSGVLAGYIVSRLHDPWISGIYYKRIILSEDVVFEQPEAIDYYGDIVIIPAGTQGNISDSVSLYGDTKGYDLINVHLAEVNGKSYDVALSFDNETDTRINEARTLIFDIGYIESSEIILSEYKNSREVYFAQVRNSRVICQIVGLSVSGILSIVFFIIYVELKKQNKSVSKLLCILTIVDVILVVSVVFFRCFIK